jgi:hypothetical protein
MAAIDHRWSATLYPAGAINSFLGKKKPAVDREAKGVDRRPVSGEGRSLAG